jgi:ribosomal protein S18 acetylase RimI-like enzyme
MDGNSLTECVYTGMEAYLRTFALSCDMLHRNDNGVEWIAHKPGRPGPSLVFKATFTECTARERIDALLLEIRSGTVPSDWFVSPGWTPENIADILLAKGFRRASKPGEPHPGMALELGNALRWPEPNPDLAVRTVQSMPDFALWCGIVNGALFGHSMLSPESYSQWFLRNVYTMYLAYEAGEPIAAAATMPMGGGHATIEFVATRKEYRRKGAATALCVRAMSDLMCDGVRVVTLRASHEGFPVYQRLGFRPCCPIAELNYPVLIPPRTAPAPC